MANPYHHALSSAKQYGGRWQDYIQIHWWMDQSKSIISDSRHRALRHHVEGIDLCESVFGARFQRRSDGVLIETHTVGEQHVVEDFGFIPSAERWLSLLPMQPWMSRYKSASDGVEHVVEHEYGRTDYPGVDAHAHALASARRFGGVPQDYLAIHEWLDATACIIGDVRHQALRHHAEGIFMCEQVFGVVFCRTSDGRRIPTRWIAEQHVLEDLGFIPSAVRWLELLPLQAWMARGARRLSEELEELQEAGCGSSESNQRGETNEVTASCTEEAAEVASVVPFRQAA
jgi:hypothetical protein